MKIKHLLFCAALICAGCACATAQEAAGSAQTAEQKAEAAEQRRKFEEALKPHLEEAKKTYPEAKKQFLAGLAPKERFLVTVELRDDKGQKMQAYLEVKEIKDGIIKGILASEIRNLARYKRGDKHSVSESELIDWIMVKADGTEEGNFVGRFLNEYQPNKRSY